MASLFETIIHGKAEINGAEDLNYIIGTILDNDETLEILHQLTLSNSAPIVYQASRVLSQALIHLYNSGEKKALQRVQEKMLMNTSLFLWNLKIMLESSSSRELEISSIIIELLLYGNPECCSIISRIFPKSLIQNTENSKECAEWKPEVWREFFKNIHLDYDSVTLQWSKECRLELSEKLKKTAIDFLTVKYTQLQEKREVKWNHEEFSHQYQWLDKKCKVGKYYLKELLANKDVNLSEKIGEPVDFWNVMKKFYYIFRGLCLNSSASPILKNSN